MRYFSFAVVSILFLSANLNAEARASKDGGQSFEGSILRAKEIVKKKGFTKSKEVLKIEPKDLRAAKGYQHLDNKYFSVDYPVCMKARFVGDDDSLSDAVNIIFDRQPSCAQYEKRFNPKFEQHSANANILEFYYDYLKADKAYIESPHPAEWLIFEQEIKIGSLPAKLFISVLDSNEKDVEPVMGWEVITLCKGKAFDFSTSLPRGKPSLDAIDKNQFEMPADFKEMISTFSCSDKK